MTIAMLTPECVAQQVENAWLRLTNLHGARRVDVYVIRSGRVMFSSDAERYSSAQLVGTYTSAVNLHDLRDDVFHVWESMQR